MYTKIGGLQYDFGCSTFALKSEVRNVGETWLLNHICLFITPSILVFVVTLIIGMFSYQKGKENPSEAYAIAQKYQWKWFGAMFFWRAVEICCPLQSFLASVIVLYLDVDVIQGSTQNGTWIFTYSVIALAFSMIGYFANAKDNIKAYRKAYETVAKALVRNCVSENKEELIEAIITGEQIIGETYE